MNIIRKQMIQGHHPDDTQLYFISNGTMDSVVGLNVEAQQEAEGWGSPGAAHPGVWPWEIKTRYCATFFTTTVTAASDVESRSEWALHASAVTVMIFVEEQYYSTYNGKEEWGNIYRCSTLHITPSQRTSKIIQRQKPEKICFTHSSTCALS